MMKFGSCDHLREFERKEPKVYECEQCAKSGDIWLHLRTCQTCGVTLCCDSSPNKHMTRHFADTGHPVVISAEEGENWAYCYVHDALKE